MAKARLNLEYFKHTVNLLAHEVGMLKGKGASRAADSEITALHKKLIKVQKLMAGECPDGLFRNFDLVEPRMATRR